MDGGPWWAAVHGVAKSRTQLSDFTFTFHFYALEKEMATHSSVFAWRIRGTGEPGGLLSMGSHRVGHDWSDLAAAAAAAFLIWANPLNCLSLLQKQPQKTSDDHMSQVGRPAGLISRMFARSKTVSCIFEVHVLGSYILVSSENIPNLSLIDFSPRYTVS